jgi:hypothetical protein
MRRASVGSDIPGSGPLQDHSSALGQQLVSGRGDHAATGGWHGHRRHGHDCLQLYQDAVRLGRCLQGGCLPAWHVICACSKSNVVVCNINWDEESLQPSLSIRALCREDSNKPAEKKSIDEEQLLPGMPSNQARVNASQSCIHTVLVHPFFQSV